MLDIQRRASVAHSYVGRVSIRSPGRECCTSRTDQMDQIDNLNQIDQIDNLNQIDHLDRIENLNQIDHVDNLNYG